MPSGLIHGINAALPHVQRTIQEVKGKQETKRQERRQDVLSAQTLRLQTAKEKRDRALAAVQAEYARKQAGEELGVKKGYLNLGWAQHLGLGKPKKTGKAGGAEKPSKYPQWYARSVKDFEDTVIDAGYSLETRDKIEAVLRKHSANPLEAYGEIDKILRTASLTGEAVSTDAATEAARGTALNAATYFFSTQQLGPAYGQEEFPGFETPPGETPAPVSTPMIETNRPGEAEELIVPEHLRGLLEETPTAPATPLERIEHKVSPQSSIEQSEMAPYVKAQEVAGMIAQNPGEMNTILAQYGQELEASGVSREGINRILGLASSLFTRMG